MSNHDNGRRGERKRTENGPRWESKNPGEGCNSTHKAKARADWKKMKNRSFRRQGVVTPKFSDFKGGQRLIAPEEEG